MLVLVYFFNDFFYFATSLAIIKIGFLDRFFGSLSSAWDPLFSINPELGEYHPHHHLLLPLHPFPHLQPLLHRSPLLFFAFFLISFALFDFCLCLQLSGVSFFPASMELEVSCNSGRRISLSSLLSHFFFVLSFIIHHALHVLSSCLLLFFLGCSLLLLLLLFWLSNLHLPDLSMSVLHLNPFNLILWQFHAQSS